MNCRSFAFSFSRASPFPIAAAACCLVCAACRTLICAARSPLWFVAIELKSTSRSLNSTPASSLYSISPFWFGSSSRNSRADPAASATPHRRMASVKPASSILLPRARESATLRSC